MLDTDGERPPNDKGISSTSAIATSTCRLGIAEEFKLSQNTSPVFVQPLLSD
jgi:hypothetical protein